MSVKWYERILVRTAAGVAGIFLLVGAVFVAITTATTSEFVHKQSASRLGELLDTVESTVSIACFVEDRQLALEVARGILKNSEVAGVAILTGGKELASAQRSNMEQRADAVRKGVEDGRLRRTVMSPFDRNQAVGEILLDPNHAEIERQVRETSRFAALLLALQLAIIAAVVVATVLHFIVRPVKFMSDRLHRLDAEAGERLPHPVGHGKNEIGRLTDDINALAGSLVAALEHEHALRLQREIDERKYRNIFDNADSGIFIADHRGRLLSCNRAFLRLTGSPTTDGDTFQKLTDLPWHHPTRPFDLIGLCLKGNIPQADDLELDIGTQTPHWLHVSLSPIGEGQVQGLVTDVTQNKLSEASARQLAVTDPLTGVGNRLGLEHHLIETLHDHPDEPFALMLVDLDDFKQVNEALGIPAGDRVLLITSSRMLGCLKDSDWVARPGGDEFFIVLHGVDRHETAARIGNRIVAAIGEPLDLHDDAPVSLGASIGITLYPADGANMATLLRNAEFALKRAKAAGGDGLQFFDTGMVTAAEQRHRLETDLRKSIQRNELRLFYQPIIDLAENRLAGAEALIRWQHPERGLVPPDDFIPLAEETGFIREMGLWVMEEACRQLALWQAEGRQMYLSINVSARQIPDALPVGTLLDAMERHGLEPRSLALEITEGVLLSDVNKGVAWLKELREAGFRTYLDDFGTGYSSLSYLKRFPVDTVKVDKSFVREMSEDSSDLALVNAVIAMARALGMTVVAEGVENAAQLALLRTMGCRYGQGYHFSKPVPAADFHNVTERIDKLLRL
ncbi:MAG: EAL domain-containing protein [Rhodocyclaceae bacterium]|nr:EAL domain-containing protein [Rhodocyclaceae bacterium]